MVVPQKRTIILGILFVLVIAIAAYLYLSERQARKELETLKSNPSTLANNPAIKLAEEVGKIAVIPQGEIPIVATVSDPAKLKAQPFFAEAKVGYKVLIFNIAGKAILYDPVEHKVVNIAPINTAGGVSSDGAAGIEGIPQE